MLRSSDGEAEKFSRNIKEQLHREKVIKYSKPDGREAGKSKWQLDHGQMYTKRRELSNCREISDCLSVNLSEIVWKVDDTSVHHWLCIAKPFSSGTDSKCQLCDTTVYSGHALTTLLHNKRSQRHHFKSEALLKTL